MDSKTLKLNCLTLGELYNEPISKNKWSVPLKVHNVMCQENFVFFGCKKIGYKDRWLDCAEDQLKAVQRELLLGPGNT